MFSQILVFLHTLSTKENIWLLCVCHNYYKKKLLFFFNVYKNEEKEHKFWRKKNQKSEFYKNKKIFQRDDIDVNKVLVSKKNHTVQRKHLNNLLDIWKWCH